MADRTIEVLLKLKPDDKSLSDAEKGILKQYSALKKVEEQANRTREKMEKLTQVGSRMAVLGAAIVAPFALAMNKYLETAKAAQDAGKPLESTQRRLLAVSQAWEASQERLGKVTAEIVLPALEKGAAVLEDVIRFAEKNPGVVKAALTIGGTLVILGGLIATTAQLVATVATIQGLAASAGLASVAGGAGAAAAGGVAAGGMAAIAAAAAPVVIAALLAVGVIALIGSAIKANEQNPNLTRGPGFVQGGLSAGQRARIGRAVGPRDGADVAALAKSEEDLAAARKKSLEAAQKILVQQHALTNAELDFAEKRAATVKDGLSEISDIEQKGVADRVAILNRLIEENRAAEYRYNQERAKIAADGARDIAQIEQDSQKRIEQLRRDFTSNSETLTRSRDALGLVKAKRDFDEQVAQERENTREEIAQRRADIALRLQDLATAYQYEQQQRQRAAQIALADQAAQQNAAIQIARTNQATILQELDAFYKAQIQILKNNMITNSSGAQGRAVGGYAESGLYRLGERGREFVLNNQTTRAAESMIGGRLNQSRALGLVTNNLQMGNGVTIRQTQRLIEANMSGMLSALAGVL